MELPVIYGEIDSAPIFPRPGETYQCAILNDFFPDRFWLTPLDEATNQHHINVEKIIKDLYNPLLKKNSSLDPEIALFDTLMDMFLRELEETDEKSDDYNEIVLEYLGALGDYAVVFIKERKSFYRAEILHESIEGNMIFTFLIDKGCFAYVTVPLLWPMSRRLTAFPQLALTGYLAGVTPQGKVEELHPVSDWPDDLLVEFRSLLSQNEVWNVTFEEKSKYMLPGLNSLTLSVNELNVNDALLKFTRKKRSVDIMNQLKGFDPMGAEYYSERNQYNVDVDDPAVAVFGHKDLDDICPFYSKTGRCFKGETCYKRHEFYHPSGINLGEAPIFIRALKQLDSLLLGVEYKLSGICINSVEEIYITLQIDNDKYGAKVRHFEKYINDPRQVKLKKFHIRPIIGEIILAEMEGVYKRAKCLNSEPNTDDYDVTFMDEAGVAQKTLHCLRAVEVDMLELPFLSRRCRLINIGGVSNEGLEALKDLAVKASAISAKIVSDLDIGCLWIELISPDSGNFGSKLIEMGLAEEKAWLIPEEWGTYGIPG